MEVTLTVTTLIAILLICMLGLFGWLRRELCDLVNRHPVVQYALHSRANWKWTLTHLCSSTPPNKYHDSEWEKWRMDEKVARTLPLEIPVTYNLQTDYQQRVPHSRWFSCTRGFEGCICKLISECTIVSYALGVPYINKFNSNCVTLSIHGIKKKKKLTNEPLLI